MSEARTEGPVSRACQASGMPERSRAGGEPRHRSRTIEIVLHVLLAVHTSFTGWPTSLAIVTAWRT